MTRSTLFHAPMRQALGGLCLAVLFVAPSFSAVKFGAGLFGGLEPRPIGPAVMGGRIAALDAVRGETLKVFVGAAGGGVWKSIDGGLSFAPVFDDHVQSIGAIRIDPSDQNTIWVGTGETWTRNSVSLGDGIYVSRDDGKSWKNVGLRNSERIARIQVDPENSKRVFACATGQLWSANKERGVFRTIDGGETWDHVLAIDENTGCGDLAMDPQNADVLYAGMWQFRRYPWSFNSGGPGSGLYRSTDGGDSWTELTEGLPKGEKGRIAIAVAPSRPNRLYATVEAKETAMYRSDDLGNSWQRTSTAMAVTVRPFYFSHLVVDPQDYNRVYKPGLFFAFSTDAGQTFSQGGQLHPDLHAVWVNPSDSKEILVGTDGGLYHSYDGGRAFRHAQSLPISQFYEVGYDLQYPYNVYGGLQDNGSWMGPSRASGGIPGSAWRNIGFGDGFHSYPDPKNADWIFIEYQGGQIMRHQLSTGALQQIKPYPNADDPEYRCSWNTAMHIGKKSGSVYVGCQFLFRSSDSGLSWNRVSGDLTTNDSEKQQQAESGGLSIDNSTAENHTTIYSISESPQNADIVWVGTDDGNVQVTRDGGKSWTNVRANIQGVPTHTWVSFVEASHHQEGAALVTFDGHRLGDMQPYVFLTEDFGATWKALGVTDQPNETDQDQPRESEDTPVNFDSRHAILSGYAHVIREDPVNMNLLFLGTEQGLFVSLDRGQRWARLGENFPKVGVRDLDIQPQQHDLVIATHGRGVYILDDLTPLRALASQDPSLLDSKLLILPGRPSVQFTSAQAQSFPGADEWIGDSLPETAHLYYYQARRHIFGDMKIEIYDAAGELVTTIPAGKRRGINRVDWPMRKSPPELPPAKGLSGAMFGPRVPEGTYTFKVLKGKDVFEGSLDLVADPRSPHSKADRALQQTLTNQLYSTLNELTFASETVSSLMIQAKDAKAGTTRRKTSELDQFHVALEEIHNHLVATSEAGWLSGEERLREQLGNLFGAIAGYDGRPTDSQVKRAAVLARALEQQVQNLESIASLETLERINRNLETAIVRKTKKQWQLDRDNNNASPQVLGLLAASSRAANLR